MVIMSQNSKNKAGAVYYESSELESRLDNPGSVKKEKFIYKFIHNTSSKIKTILEKLKTTQESSLDNYEDRTLLQVFLDWLLEILHYGSIALLFVNVFIQFLGWHNTYMWFVFGLLRWAFLDLLSDIIEKFK